MKLKLFWVAVLASCCAFGKVSAPSGGGVNDTPVNKTEYGVNVGHYSGMYSVGNGNNFFGAYAGNRCLSTNNTALGVNAGSYATNSYWLYIDNIDTPHPNPVNSFIALNGTNGTAYIGRTNGTLTLRGDVRLSWAAVPASLTSAGVSGQLSISSDTNQFFYWFSPTAVSGGTTGIWLRAVGETF